MRKRWIDILVFLGNSSKLNRPNSTANSWATHELTMTTHYILRSFIILVKVRSYVRYRYGTKFPSLLATFLLHLQVAVLQALPPWIKDLDQLWVEGEKGNELIAWAVTSFLLFLCKRYASGKYTRSIDIIIYILYICSSDTWVSYLYFSRDSYLSLCFLQIYWPLYI